MFKHTDPILVPATSTDTSPPSTLAAVRALRVTAASFSLLCSAIIKVLCNLCPLTLTRQKKIRCLDFFGLFGVMFFLYCTHHRTEVLRILQNVIQNHNYNRSQIILPEKQSS